MEFPCEYIDRNGKAWYCETMGDYLYCASCDAEEAFDEESRDYPGPAFSDNEYGDGEICS